MIKIFCHELRVGEYALYNIPTQYSNIVYTCYSKLGRLCSTDLKCPVQTLTCMHWFTNHYIENTHTTK